MDKKAFVLIALILLLAVPAADAWSWNPATWISRAFRIGDGKDIDLNQQAIGNGNAWNITCQGNCTNFNGTTGATGANASNFSYTYYIFTDGKTVWVKNGSTGAIDFTGTDTRVINTTTTSLNGSGGVVLIAGSYSYAGQIVLPSDVVLDGMGATTIILNSSYNPPAGGETGLESPMIVNSNPSGTTGNRNITVRGMRLIWLNRTASPSVYWGVGISLNGVNNSVVENNYLQGMPAFGIWIKGYYVNSKYDTQTTATIQNNICSDVGNRTGAPDNVLGCILLTNKAVSSSITNNHGYNVSAMVSVEDSVINTVVSANSVNLCNYGIRDEANGYGNIFKDNTMEQCRFGVFAHASTSADYADNMINGSDTAGYWIQQGHTNIHGGYVWKSQYGLLLNQSAGADYNDITNIGIYQPTLDGIWVSDLYDKITNNRIETAGRTGINITYSGGSTYPDALVNYNYVYSSANVDYNISANTFFCQNINATAWVLLAVGKRC